MVATTPVTGRTVSLYDASLHKVRKPFLVVSPYGLTAQVQRSARPFHRTINARSARADPLQRRVRRAPITPLEQFSLCALLVIRPALAPGSKTKALCFSGHHT